MKSAKDYYNKGINLYNEKEYQKAQYYLKIAAEQEPDNDNYLYYCGLAYYYVDGSEHTAAEYLKKAIELNKNEPNYFYFYGSACFYLNNYDEAVESFSMGIKLAPDDIFYYYWERGKCKEKLNDLNEALNDYSLAFKNVPEDDQDNINDIQEAIDRIKALLENSSDNNENAIDEQNYAIEENVNYDGDILSEEDQVSFIGIDFGTTNTALVSITGTNEQNQQIIKFGKNDNPVPSVVAIKKDGSGDTKTGFDITDKELLDGLDDNYEYFWSIKSLIENNNPVCIGNKEYYPGDFAEILFKSIKENLFKTRNIDLTEAVVAVPVGFKSKEKIILRNAAKKAGFNISMFVSEPTAAYIANRDDKKLKKYNDMVVFDWGGGTLDVAALHIDDCKIYEIATGGKKEAGDDIDLCIAKHIYGMIDDSNEKIDNEYFEELPLSLRAKFKFESERVKKELQENDTTEFILLKESVQETVTYNEFEQLTEEIIENAITCLKQTIKEAGLNDIKLQKILCVGGSSKLKNLQSRLNLEYPGKITIANDSDWSVAIGAAQIAQKKGHYALSKPIGILLSDGSLLELVSKDDTIPTTADNLRPAVLSLTDTSESANFVFAESENNHLGYQVIPVRNFDNTKTMIKGIIDENFIFNAVIASNTKKPINLWQYDKVKVYYDMKNG